jgi:LEA14-like dessication related protein
MIKPRLATLLTAALCLGAFLGCAGFGKQLLPPEVSLVDLRPLPSESLEQRFEVKIRVLNPNDVDLAGDGVDLILEINERRLGRAVSSEPFLIPRLGDEVIVLVATANWLDVLRQAIALPEARGIEYTLRGRLFLADSPTWLRFEHEGSLLPELLPRAG